MIYQKKTLNFFVITEKKREKEYQQFLTMSFEKNIENTTDKVIRKLLFPDFILNTKDQHIFDTIKITVKMIHTSSSYSEFFKKRLNEEFQLYIQHSCESKVKPKPDIWLIEFYQLLIFKLENRVGWRSLINQIFITECMLEQVDEMCNRKVTDYKFVPEFSLKFRLQIECILSKYIKQKYSLFILEMGGWDDLQDYHDFHKSFKKPKSKTLLFFISVIACISYMCIKL